MTHGDKLHKIMKVTKPAVAGAVSNGLAQAGFTVKHRLHGAVLGKGAVPGGAVPVHLAVKVVAIQFLCSRLEIVGVVAGPSRHGYKAGAAVVAFIGPVVASEEEQLVLLNGATESAAKIIELTVPLGASLKELPCPQSLVLKVLKTNSMVLIGA